MTQTIHPQRTLADLASSFPSASRIFHTHSLDYCCSGRRTLHQACADAGLDLDPILQELQHAADHDPAPTDWTRRPLPDLVDHILTTYHEPLRAELPAVIDMADKVERVHARAKDAPLGLANHLRQLHTELESHMQKEERILFPLIVSGDGAHAGGPIRVMELEHDDHAQNLQRTRALTNDLQPPSHACTTWRALYLRLQQLERDLMDHVHLENHVLFPTALAH